LSKSIAETFPIEVEIEKLEEEEEDQMGLRFLSLFL
jgi:hypothetical protein